MRTFLFLTAVLLSACTNAPYNSPPSTAGAQTSVNSARGKVDTGISENRAAMEGNRKARTNAELIDNKASVIERFWK